MLPPETPSTLLPDAPPELAWWLELTRLYAWIVFLLAWLQIGRGDWLHQKIRNSYLRYWSRLILPAYAVLLAGTALGRHGFLEQFLQWEYYGDLLFYLLLSAASAGVLWRLNVWPAGDAKLFLFLALFYPLMDLPASFRGGLRFLEVLINAFLLSSAVLLCLSLDYVWRTRMAHQREFLRSMGLRRELHFLLGESRAATADLARLARAWLKRLWLKWRGPEAVERVKVPGLRLLGRLLEDPAGRAVELLDYALSVIAASLVAYTLRDVVRSVAVKSLLLFFLLFFWEQFKAALGRRTSLALVALGLCAAFVRSSNTEWDRLLASLANISVFALCIRFGMSWALQVLTGRVALLFLAVTGLAALPLADLVLVPLVGWLILPPAQFLLALVPWDWLGRLGLGWLSALAGRVSAWAEEPVTAEWVPDASLLGFLADSTIAAWAGMGTFLGLGLVLVRVWDLESYRSVTAGEIEPYMLLGPEARARVAADEELADELGTLYADGLTPEQAELLRDWCRSEGLERLPLAPTISFASPIFVGYLVTVLLDGHILGFLLEP